MGMHVCVVAPDMYMMNPWFSVVRDRHCRKVCTPFVLHQLIGYFQLAMAIYDCFLLELEMCLRAPEIPILCCEWTSLSA